MRHSRCAFDNFLADFGGGASAISFDTLSPLVH